MPILNKIINKFYSKGEKDVHLLILRLLNFLNIIIIGYIMVISYVIDLRIVPIISLFTILLLSANLALSTISKFANFSKFSYLFLILLFSIFLNVHTSATPLIFFFVLFPINSFFALGVKQGNFISILAFPVFILSIIIPLIIKPAYTIDSFTFVILFSSYIFIHIIVYVFEFIKNAHTNKLIDELNDSKKLNIQKDQFLSNLSHQIRTPLNNISVVTNLLNTPDLDAKQKDLLDTILASANNLANVVNNISEIPNIETVESSDYHINFDLQPTVESTISLFHQQNQKNLKINL